MSTAVGFLAPPNSPLTRRPSALSYLSYVSTDSATYNPGHVSFQEAQAVSLSPPQQPPVLRDVADLYAPREHYTQPHRRMHSSSSTSSSAYSDDSRSLYAATIPSARNGDASATAGGYEEQRYTMPTSGRGFASPSPVRRPRRSTSSSYSSRRSCEEMTKQETRDLWRCMLDLQGQYGCYNSRRIDLAMRARGEDEVDELMPNPAIMDMLNKTVQDLPPEGWDRLNSCFITGSPVRKPKSRASRFFRNLVS